ncbi:MAG TPA: FtsX-like permease family protein [Vicinamibacteria bacterium]
MTRAGLRFALAHAAREGRSSARRLLLLAGSVALGVGALVAINSFTAGLQDSVRSQARELLGADLALGSAQTFSARAEAELAAMERAASGAELARVVRFAAMAYVPGREGSPRLAQVTAVEGGYPFYGAIGTEPQGQWPQLTRGGGVLVDPALLTALGARLGDTLALGEARLPIRGTVTRVPGDVSVRAAFGPRLFMALSDVPATGLLGFGARARYEAYLKVPASAGPQRLALRYRGPLLAERVTLRTVTEDQQGLNDSLGRLGRFLGLVALVALLLGGLGVASAVQVLIRRRLETIAVLRCLGASAGTLLAAYLAQAAAMAFAGSLLGAGLAVGLQAVLPRLLAALLPVDVAFHFAWRPVVEGLGVGVLVAVLFALPPLLAVRHVSPLLVLRRPYDEGAPPRRDRARWAAFALLGAGVAAVAVRQAGDLVTGLVFAAGVGVALGALRLAAMGTARLLRRALRPRWSYVVRQGVANLFRPANQTAAVVVALGFGAFLLNTLWMVEANLLRDLRPGAAAADRPNLVVFDVQPDQRPAVEAALQAAGPSQPAVPIVPMRILSVKGRAAATALAKGTVGPRADRPRGGGGWALRREYRSTYRDVATPSERVVAGRPWEAGSWRGRVPSEQDPVPVSVERGLADELDVRLGDAIVWDVQGRAVPSRVASLREVEWARFEPNFFVVFPEGPLAEAPQTFVSLVRLPDVAARAQLTRRLVEAFPNVTAVDLTELQQAVEAVVGRVAFVVRFLALFSLGSGGLVLLGAVATSRYQRLREGVLLKALGATRGQLLRINLVEHAVLGAVGAAAALLLATVAGWALVTYLFEARFVLPLLPLLGFAAALVAATAAVGVAGSAGLLRQSPLAALRAE